MHGYAEGYGMVSYIIRAARDEEANDGWIWMALPSRTVVRIKNPSARRHVYCQVRDIRDPNFLKRYNTSNAGRIAISHPCETMVISNWYRDALGGFNTTGKDNETGRVGLDVKPVQRWGWEALRAASHHPDIVVRLGVRLGVLGAWLGILGLIFGLTPLDAMWLSGEFSEGADLCR